MKRILTAIIPLALLGACQTLPATSGTADAAPSSAPVPETPPVETEAPETNAAAEPDTAPAIADQPRETFIRFRTSPLVSSLVSDSVMNDDVALMGILSGARAQCGLDWQPGFVAFINIANGQRLNLGRVADDHGYYMGSAKRALEEAEYKCTEQDLIDLRQIEPY